MTRPTLIDLYCNAGGAGEGYHRAGFRVIGVDLHPQPNYPHEFVQADALSLTPEWFAYMGAAAAHASPPCQGYTEMIAPGQVGAPRLIRPTRGLMAATGLPWVLENVEGARDEMPDAITLCGSMFGLGVRSREAWLKRHRLFEASFPIYAPTTCHHPADRPCVGVYGGHARIRAAKHGGRTTRDPWTGGHRAAMSEAMGITWATCAEMSEGIPPAYTQWLGALLMQELGL